MADNKTANAGSGGATFVTAQGSWSGDTADLPGSFIIIASGSEGAWTFSTVVGNSGNLAAGVQRVCIATDDVNLSAIKTAIEILDNTVSGSEMQVDVVGSLPAGTNAIGKLAANSGVDIGDVDILSIAAGDNNIGNVDIASIAAGTNTIGKVRIVDGIGNEIDVTDGKLVVNVTEMGTSTGAILTATNVATPQAMEIFTFPLLYDGATWDFALGNSTDGQLVNLGANNDVTVTGSVTANAGTNLNTSTLALESGGNLAAAATSLAILDDWDNGASDGASVSGDVAHGTADAGEPVKIGAKVETSLKGITVEADGDRTNLYADADGVQVVKLGTTGADAISERVSNTDGASTAFSNFSQVASTYNNITGYSIFRTDAGSSLAYVDFRDGTAGSVLWSVPVPAGGGANLSLGGQPIFKTSANTALAYDVSAALNAVIISVTGFQSKV